MSKASSLLNYNTRYILPLLIGLIVGFAFSLICMPFFDCDSGTASGVYLYDENGNVVHDPRLKRSDEANQRELDDFEPRINLQGKPKKPQKPAFKLVRPRYAATELGIREKLFIGVIINADTLNTLAIAINRTVSAYTNKLVFFVNNLNADEKHLYNSIPKGLSVISFNDNHEILKPFLTIQYILDNHINNYDWFMLIGDNAYMRGEKILTFLNHISISQDLYMGNSVNDIYCSLDTGIVFSNSVMRKLVNQIDWCKNNAYSSEATDNIGRCILHATNLPCTSFASGQNFTYFYHKETINTDMDLSMFSLIPSFNQSLTVYPVRDLENMLKLQIYFDEVEMNEIKNDIKKLEQNIVDTSCETPEGCYGLTWPLGVPPPFQPTNRYEVIKWDYFNDTHIFLEGDFDVVNELKEDFKYDIDEVVEFSVKNLNQIANAKNRFKFVTILNGYKQFDPTRGATYVMDLKLHDTLLNQNIHKRVDVMRPLGLIELVTMPYVTENSKITLVITFAADYDKTYIDSFFSSYQKSVLEVSEVAEKLNLFVVHVNTNSTEELGKASEENIKYIKNIISELERKFSSLTTSSSRILQEEIIINNPTLYEIENYRQVYAMEHIMNRLSSDALIFISPPGIEFELEFLNRVRLNTIKAHQLFFPIAFYQYHPNIVYEQQPYPETVELNKNIGYFNTYSYDFGAFYNYDYINTRNAYLSTQLNIPLAKLIKMPLNLADHITDLYELFRTNRTLHLLRATDQALKYRWHLIDNCEKRRNKDEIERCTAQLERGLGTRAQLALHLVQYYKDENNESKN